ncbi:hypothetical protein [Paenibacillus lutrae]|uniref:Uncharacterized protein n=1 Tax=Paenibacillus lutrae TaxID=2078573 RepID=A0A7X3FFM1_9BACL|nr:hypothetical protein [Paenibacillus lutrae]MVO98782.1 hypothetical protein [Paenibacillus lutrae]
MKKFVSGMIAGIGISACTIVFASPSLQAKNSGATQTIEKLSRYTRWDYDLTARQIKDGF